METKISRWAAVCNHRGATIIPQGTTAHEYIVKLSEEDVKTVYRCIDYFRGLNKGIAPAGTTWDDLRQDVFVRLLESEKYDPERGPVGLYIFEVTKDRFLNAVRPSKRPSIFYVEDVSGVGPLAPGDYHVAVDAQDFLESLSPDVQEAVKNQREGRRPKRQTKEERTHDRLVSKARKALRAD